MHITLPSTYIKIPNFQLTAVHTRTGDTPSPVTGPVRSPVLSGGVPSPVQGIPLDRTGGILFWTALFSWKGEG